MRKIDVVLICKDGYVHKKKIYENHNIKALLESVKKRIKIIIMDESLLVKEINCDKKGSKILDIVENVISEGFSKYQDLLFDYEYDRKSKKIYLYAINDAYKVDKIIEKSRSIKVIPVQYLIKKIIKKKFRNVRSYISIVNISNTFYLIDVQNNYILSAESKNNINDLNKIINKSISDNRVIITDNSMKNIKEFKLENCRFFELGEKITDELY